MSDEEKRIREEQEAMIAKVEARRAPPPTLDQLARFMSEHKLVRLVYVDGADRVEMERHASAFAPEVPDTPTEREDKDRCACGHSLSIEHTETGCAFGCDPAVCNGTKE